MATKPDDRPSRDDGPATPIETDATERHLLKTRELLREARFRFKSRDDAPSNRETEPTRRHGSSK